MRPAVFLDRDDTLIACRSLRAPPPPARPGDLVDARQVELLPGVDEALARLAAAGFSLVVVSNQGVVARGGATLVQVEAVNERLREVIREQAGVELDGIYFCPFHPGPFDGEVESVRSFRREHPWRKPAPGMILAASHELGLDPARSWLVGDGQRDIEAGIAGGLPPHRCLRIGDDSELSDLSAAADVILAEDSLLEIVGQGGEVCTVLMHAADATAFADERVRGTVIATARAAADREHLRLLFVGFEGDALCVTLGGGRLEGLGLLAEVRRITDRWSQTRGGPPLWRGTGGHS